jgi:protein-S-isoprenylcysteine O-methyltransferase Ste14
MISAVLMLLAAEALMLDSWPLAVWLAVFYIANAIYIPRFEERGLERRFGAAWRRYKAHVPRWFPTPVAYDPEEERQHMRGS